jgi:hypothetical protein
MLFDNKDNKETIKEKKSIENYKFHPLKKDKNQILDKQVMTIEELLESGLYEDTLGVYSNYPIDIETGIIVCKKKI